MDVNDNRTKENVIELDRPICKSLNCKDKHKKEVQDSLVA